MPGLPAITFRRSVVDGIHAEVLHGFNAIPKRGAEVGGILLGSREEDQVLIEDFEPVPCEHRFGPSYQLSAADYHALEETLQYFRAEPRHGLSVVGFYRSHTRPEFSLSEEDVKLFETHFPDPSQVFLLIRPSRLQQSVADFFFWRDGELRQALHLAPFPFRESAPVAGRRVPKAERQQPVKEPRPPAPTRPAPVQPEPTTVVWPVERYEERVPSQHGWLWGTAVAVLAIIAGSLAYREYQEEAKAPAEQSAVQEAVVPDVPDARTVPQETPATSPPVVPEPSAAVPAAAAPVEPAPVEPEPPKPEPAATAPEPASPAAIRNLLERWSSAIRYGDAEAAARCYAPQLTTYLGRSGATPSDVRGRIQFMHGRYGKLAIHRIGNLGVALSGRDFATVSFRRHWETAGANKTSGESQQQMTLVRTAGGWKIASEQETRIY